jgi:beta-fructofuranosidase
VARRALIPALSDIRIVVDTSILELYVNGGGWVFSTRYFDEGDDLQVTSTFEGTDAVWYPMTPITLDYLVER